MTVATAAATATTGDTPTVPTAEDGLDELEERGGGAAVVLEYLQKLCWLREIGMHGGVS